MHASKIDNVWHQGMDDVAGRSWELDAKTKPTQTHTALAKFTLSKVPANNPVREKRHASSEFWVLRGVQRDTCLGDRWRHQDFCCAAPELSVVECHHNLSLNWQFEQRMSGIGAEPRVGPSTTDLMTDRSPQGERRDYKVRQHGNRH